MNRTVTVAAPAKLNLRLVVLAREASGYHSIETLLCGISLADRLEISPATPGIQLEIVGDPPTADPEDDLTVRAARAFHQEIAAEPAIHLRVHKVIPAAAGLGGGSSDAAATLRALNHLHGQPLRDASLRALGAALGSDVTFFLSDTPLALAWGRGERLLQLDTLPRRTVLVVHPGESISTPAAFKRYAELRGDDIVPVPHVISSHQLSNWDALREYAVNDLELVAFEKIPRLPHALRALLDSGASTALLAGSGSAVFGIFPLDADLRSTVRTLERNGFRCWTAETLEAWPQLSIGD